MASSGPLRILLLLILVMNVQVLTLSNLFLSKRCPRLREKCSFKERDVCKNNKNCPGNMKCCVFNCGKKCLDLKQDICSLPKDPGPCFGLFIRWWYNKKNGSCNEFDYGGCQGNNNNFQTKDLCLNMCSKKRESQGPQSFILAKATGEVWVPASLIWEDYILGGPGADRTSSY